MDRVLRGTTATLSATWYDASGTIVDPGAVTVEIDRDSDGTALVAAGTATSGSGAAARTFALTTAHTANLDLLKATWTSPTLGTLTTYAEVVGGFLFSVADARKLKPLDDATAYPAADIATARTAAETALEDACLVSFVPRYRKEVRDSPLYSRVMVLQRARPTLLRSISRDGIAFSSGQLANIALRPQGSLYSMTAWPPAITSYYTVAYEHGYPYPPPRVGRAALLLARRWLVESPVDERTTQVQTEGGRIEFLTAADDIFDIPEVNAVVREYGMGPLVA